MENTVSNDDVFLSKEMGRIALSAGAGFGTAGTAYILLGQVTENIGKNGINIAHNYNSIFKDEAIKAFENEKIFCTTPDKVLGTLSSISLKDLEVPDKHMTSNIHAATVLMHSPNDFVTKINDKINEPFMKLISKLKQKKSNTTSKVTEQCKKGLNAFAKQDVVFADLDKLSIAAFHEMGHVKNYQSKGLAKALRSLKHPLIKKISIATAMAGAILPLDKEENGYKNKTVLNKAGDFLSNNCVAISTLATAPTVLEEGLASIKGAKIASKVMPTDKLKMVNNLNRKMFLTYAILSTALPLGVYTAKKTREMLG